MITLSTCAASLTSGTAKSFLLDGHHIHIPCSIIWLLVCLWCFQTRCSSNYTVLATFVHLTVAISILLFTFTGLRIVPCHHLTSLLSYMYYTYFCHFTHNFQVSKTFISICCRGYHHSLSSNTAIMMAFCLKKFVNVMGGGGGGGQPMLKILFNIWM